MMFGAGAQAGYWDFNEEKVEVRTDRATGIEVTTTKQMTQGQGGQLTLITQSQDNGYEGRKFQLISTSTFYVVEKITMMIDDGNHKGRYITWDYFEVTRDYGTKGYHEWMPVNGKAEIADLITPFSKMLKEAQKKGDVKYFIRVHGEDYHIDFDYTLKSNDSLPAFFN